MTEPDPTRSTTVLLVGNPNVGKTTLFNALTGFRRHVANYPGVTVEIARGALRGSSGGVEIVDLPGTYSLAAAAPDEAMVSEMALGTGDGRAPADAILAVVDASNLPRNLYLVSQVMELGVPVIVALNMIDVARQRGLGIDAEGLSGRLGVPVIPVVATNEATIAPLVAALDRVCSMREPSVGVSLPEPLEAEISQMADAAARSEALRILLDRDGAAERRYLERGGDGQRLRAARERLTAAGIVGVAAEVRARYTWIARVLEGVVSRPARPIETRSDRIDRILTHPIAGLAVLLVVLTIVFQAIFRWATPIMDLISDGLFGGLATRVASMMPEGAIRSLVCDGLIGGVGGVLVFLPQILILFGMIAILEDCGYMSRAAFMMDRVMRAAGLSGRSFIPLLSSFACAIPAIMGARVIADRRDRLVTILIAPFMSCSARLPVYVLLIAAFVPDERYWGGWIGLPGLVMLAMYLVGITVAIPAAWLLKRTVLSGPTPAFLLELPSYKLPRLRSMWQRMYFAGRSFVVQAGTIILLVNVAVWALGYFPRDAAVGEGARAAAMADSVPEDAIEARIEGAYLSDSFLGRAGRLIEPAIRPIGWDWRIGAAAIASFPAREVVVGTLGTIFNLSNADEEPSRLGDVLKAARWPDGRPLFTLPVALSIMVFFALCAQCASTLVIIGRETGSWVWPVASFAGMTTIAYVAALATATGARALGW